MPELIYRFDYICKFNQLQKKDKENFLNDYLQDLKKKYEKKYNKKISDDIIGSIKKVIDIDNCCNIRILKKDVACKFIEIVEN